MKIKKLRFSNYKAFKNQQEVEIKPITILFGRNSSGKSAVMRLPLLLTQSLHPNTKAPIELEFDGLEFGGSFKDLVHNRFEHGKLSFGLTFEDRFGEINLDFDIQNIAGTPIQFISKYNLRSTDFEINLEWKLENEINTQRLYLLNHSETCSVTFSGLFIEKISGGNVDIQKLSQLKFRLWDIIGKIDYLGPFRQLPKRDYIYKGSMPESVGFSGELAPQILAIDQFQNNSIINSVGEWYKNNLGGWRLEIQKKQDKFEVVLVSPDDENVKVNLVDVGHGMSQVLPLIVRNFQNNQSSLNLTIVEQPELHLHPGAHGNLMELIVANSSKGLSNWMIETHSEIFILRLRTLIAEKIVKHSDVAIYWIDDTDRPGSNVRKIEIDEKGDLNFWPEGVFSEDYDELINLRKAQSKVNDNESRV